MGFSIVKLRVISQLLLTDVKFINLREEPFGLYLVGPLPHPNTELF